MKLILGNLQLNNICFFLTRLRNIFWLPSERELITKDRRGDMISEHETTSLIESQIDDSNFTKYRSKKQLLEALDDKIWTLTQLRRDIVERISNPNTAQVIQLFKN